MKFVDKLGIVGLGTGIIAIGFSAVIFGSDNLKIFFNLPEWLFLLYFIGGLAIMGIGLIWTIKMLRSENSTNNSKHSRSRSTIDWNKILLFISTVATVATVIFAFLTVRAAQETLDFLKNPQNILDIKLYWGINIMPNNPKIIGSVAQLGSPITFNISIKNVGTADTTIAVIGLCKGNFFVGIVPTNGGANCQSSTNNVLYLYHSVVSQDKFTQSLSINPYNIDVGKNMTGSIQFIIYNQGQDKVITKPLNVEVTITNDTQGNWLVVPT